MWIKKIKFRVRGLAVWAKKPIKFSEVKLIYSLAGLVFLTALVLLVYFVFGLIYSPRPKSATELSVNSTSAEKECEHKRILDGICVGSSRHINPDVVAIMIENNLEAWPLSGVAAASIVYEAPVEGNIPRYLAIYAADTEIEQVGPVRSARPYYLDWAAEYGNLMYMHVGGSPEALALIDTYNIFNINEFYRGWYFWRENGTRKAPHNTYTSRALWEKALVDYRPYSERENYDGWVFDKVADCVADCVAEIIVSFSPERAYQAIWKFNTSTQKYVRFQGDFPARDIDGEEISADTVIVQRVKAKIIDEVGRREINTIGRGEAVIFRNGQAFSGQWLKVSRKDRTQWYDDDENLISLRAGKIWIEVLPENKELSY